MASAQYKVITSGTFHLLPSSETLATVLTSNQLMTGLIGEFETLVTITSLTLNSKTRDAVS